MEDLKSDYNLGQIKWNIETTPPPKISDGKMAHFGLHAPSSLIWGRGGISVPFYSVQDCKCTLPPGAVQIGYLSTPVKKDSVSLDLHRCLNNYMSCTIRHVRIKTAYHCGYS